MNQRDVPNLDFKSAKQAVSVPDVLDAFGLLDRFEVKGNRLSGQCPLPQHVHTAPIPNTQQFRADCRKDGKTWEWFCFGDCHEGGDVLKLILKLGRFDSYGHVRLWLWQRFRDRLGGAVQPSRRHQANGGTKKADEGDRFASVSPSPTIQRSKVILPPRPDGVQPLRWFYAVEPSAYLLEERGFRPETLAYFGNIGVAAKGWAKGRIAIPLFWHDQPESENPVSYVTRFNGDRESWNDESPKYRFYTGFPREKYVYALRETLASSLPESGVVVVEGVTDCWRLFQEADLRNVAATLGAGMTDDQAAVIAATGREITMVYDGNAQTQMRTAAGKLIAAGAPAVRLVSLREDQEPDNLTADEIRDLMPHLFT